jgi:hypothetical protein
VRHLGAGTAEQSRVAAERFAAAHRALRADSDIQFDLHRAKPPTPTPAWLRAFGHWIGETLKPVGRFFHWIGSFMPDAPYARIVLWGVLAVAAVALLWMLLDRFREGMWRLPRWRRRGASGVAGDEDQAWQPELAPARAWLEEADALASEGLFADAAHHLLIRSIEDIGRRRPGLVRPALTSRELARASAVPPRARDLFSGIAAVVERSLFGGRSVDRDEWLACRSAYADFARTPAWKPA